MDFESLSLCLCKPSQQWSTKDTSIWLQFIHLPELINIFQQFGVDGSCIHLLDEEILKTELNVNSAIKRKKIINWVGIGLQGYDQYCNSVINSSTKVQLCQKEQKQQENKEILDEYQVKFQVPQFKKASTTSLRYESKSKPIKHHHHEEIQNQTCLILQQFQGNSLGFHVIKNEPMSIGFGKSNHIHSLETSISERHALITRKGSAYFIQDLGSKFGTYMKINQRMLLRNGMILEIGSYQFLVKDIDTIEKVVKFRQIYCCEDLLKQGENKNRMNLSQQDKKSKKQQNTLIIDLKVKSKYTFGRRKQNDFQRDDKHMSGIHSKITFINNGFFIQDYDSTNGTWLRLSPQNVSSAQTLIQNECIIKLGSAITYICRINNSQQNNKNRNKQIEDTEMVDENLCKVCKKQQNNCLFMPCSHNMCCMGCSASVGNSCPQCQYTIAQKIRIHK